MRLAMMLLLLLAPAAGAQTDPAPVRAAPFQDVPRDHWAFDAVESLRQKGILRGYPMRTTKVEKRTTKVEARRR